MKKLLILLLLSLGFVGSAYAEMTTISDFIQIFPALWGLVKLYWGFPGVLIISVFYDTFLGHFFEVGRYGDVISTIINFAYWIGGLLIFVFINDYLKGYDLGIEYANSLGYELSKSRGIKVFEKIRSWLYLVWFLLPALLGMIIKIISPEFPFYWF